MHTKAMHTKAVQAKKGEAPARNLNYMQELSFP